MFEDQIGKFEHLWVERGVAVLSKSEGVWKQKFFFKMMFMGLTLERPCWKLNAKRDRSSENAYFSTFKI